MKLRDQDPGIERGMSNFNLLSCLIQAFHLSLRSGSTTVLFVKRKDEDLT